MNWISDFAAVIGYAVVGASAVSAFVWWLFRTFSEKWVEREI